MTSDVVPETREIRIGASLQNISAVRRIVHESACRAGLSQEEVSDLLLAVSEACNNAVQHGTRDLLLAEISVRTHVEPGVMHVEVRDPGSGFDPGDLWEPDSEMASGRGMLLMMQLTDKVEYTIDGRSTTVKLTKHSRAAEGGVGGSGALLAEALGSAGRRYSRLQYVFDVCRTVSGTLDLSRVLAGVAECTAQLFGVARARVLLHDPRRRTTTVAASWGEWLKVHPPSEAPMATRQAVYVSGQEATVGDLESRREAKPAVEAVRSSISVPIVSRGEVVGSIHLDNFQRPRRFSRSDVTALRAIAAQAAVAIENARLYREVQRHVEELAAIGEVAQSLNASLDLDRILRTILDKTRDLLGVDVCAVMLLDEEGYLSVRASHGMSETYVRYQRSLLHESPLARAISERRVIAAWDLRPYDIARGLFEGVVSAAAAPMLLSDRPIGTLNIYTRERYRFMEDQLRVLQALAEHTALAVHNAHLYEMSQQAREQLEASLQRSGSAFDTAKEPQEAIRLVAELAAQVLGMDGGVFVLPEAGITIGAGPLPPENLDSRTQGALEQAAQMACERGADLSGVDLEGHAAGTLLREAGIVSYLAVPVTPQGGQRGALCVYGRMAREFGSREAALLNSFAEQAATVVENQRLLQDAHLRLEELGTLLEVGQSIVAKLDLESVLNRIIQHVSRMMGAQVCSILLRNRLTGELDVAASQGLEQQHGRSLRMPHAEGVVGAVLRDGQPRAVADIRRHPEFVYQDVTEALGLRALLCVPLATAAGVLGVLNVYYTSVHPWTDAEIKFLSALGTQAAIAIQNATLYQQEHQVAQALQKALVPARPPAVPSLEIGQVYVPAGEQAQVGGDYYDFVMLDRGRLGIIIADVSGKGLRAATGTAMGKYILRAYLLENPMPGEAVRRANQALCRQFQEETTFLSLFYALWDASTHHLTYVNAGHPYPFLWREEEGACQALRSPETMLLGILPDHTFSEQRLLIRPGDVLLAYTDGISEARGGTQQFGIGGVERAFRELVHEPAQAIAEKIFQRACDFRSGCSADDVTVLVVKFRI